jgi:hypothetical protein
MWPSSCFNSLSFISLLCHPFPLLHYKNTACLFLFWSSSLLHYSSFCCSDPPRVKEHRLDLGVCIFMTSLHVWPAFCLFVCLFIVVAIMILIDHNTSATRQGDINHALRTRPITPIRVLQLPKAENHLPNRSLGVHFLQVWTGTWASFFILSVIFFLSSICKQQLLRLIFFFTNFFLRSKQIV